MTPPLTPPTDNLYKFIAISGLLLFFASVYFPTTLILSLNEKYIQNVESTKILDADIFYMKIKLDRLGELITNSINEKNGIYLPNTNKLVIRSSESEVKQMVNEIEELSHQHEVNLAKNDANKLRMQTLEKYKSKALHIQMVSLDLSMCITVIGFVLWYHKIQKHVDREMKKHGNRQEK